MPKRSFKKGKTLSGGQRVYRKWSDFDEGDAVIGKYVGSSIDNYKKPSWHIEVEDAQFADKKAAKALIGKVWGANASGKLNKAMEEVEEGTFVQITYLGKSEMQSGPYEGSDAHDIEVVELEEEGAESDDEDEDDDIDEEDEDDGYDV